MGKIYQIYGEDAREMTLALLQAADAASLVPAGGNVALKPNLVVAGTAENGAVTHPGVLSGCIEYFRAHGVEDICVMEGSWVGDETGRAMRRAGYDKVCEKYGIPFYDLKKDQTRVVKTAAGPIKVCARALDAGLLVNLPVLKGHCQTLMTCALKNLKGCLPDAEKRHFHAMGLQKPIAALAAALRPGLTIVDSICGDLDFEEGGTPVQADRMYLGTDPVQLDAYGLQLMGFSFDDVPYVRLCEQYGGGSARFSPADLVELNRPDEKLPAARPRRLQSKLTGNVRENQACSACYAALVRAMYNHPYSGGEEVFIGQGWRGQELDGLGVGNCCRGARACVKGCPPTAEAIAAFLEEN